MLVKDDGWAQECHHVNAGVLVLLDKSDISYIYLTLLLLGVGLAGPDYFIFLINHFFDMKVNWTCFDF